MLGSKAVQAFRQFSTTAVRRGGHQYEGPGHVSYYQKNVIYVGLSSGYEFECTIYPFI